VKDAQQEVALPRFVDKVIRFGSGNGEGFVHHHMLARLQSHLAERMVGMVWGGDDHQLNLFVCQKLFGLRISAHVPLLARLFAALRIPRRDRYQTQAFNLANEWTVENTSRISVAHNANAYQFATSRRLDIVRSL